MTWRTRRAGQKLQNANTLLDVCSGVSLVPESVAGLWVGSVGMLVGERGGMWHWIANQWVMLDAGH